MIGLIHVHVGTTLVGTLDGERETETERQRQIQRDRETERQRDRDRDTERGLAKGFHMSRLRLHSCC